MKELTVSWNVYSNDGHRKYLTGSEIDNFLRLAKTHDESIYSFCWIMAVTGCRISEALSLGEQSIDFEAQQVIILCLKKRNKRVFRAIPLPQDLLRRLERWMNNGTLPRERFWPWSRMTAYRHVRQIMQEAGFSGSYASPKGLRHGFAVRAVQSNVPLNMVQRWLGHADIKTTAIYTSATGPEERELASRLWPGRTERARPRSQISPRRRIMSVQREGAESGLLPPADHANGAVKSLNFQGIPPVAPERNDLESAGNDREGGMNLGSEIGTSHHIGSFLPCLLLHYWLNCNSNFDYKSVSYA